MDIRETVRARMAEVLGSTPDRIHDESVLTDLVNSSFLLVEMVIELQEEFDVRFQQSDLAEVANVGQLLDLVESRIEAAA
ncbi:MAG: phosphopantetheine-binding protein [Woeseiaceae bacterium]|nr:phosphopantetheine-binding protein [Woeseiaceae bacterium]